MQKFGITSAFVVAALIQLAEPAKAAPGFPSSVDFECPEAGTTFTYDIFTVAGQRNQLTSLGRDGFRCRMHSTAIGDYSWIGGVVPALSALYYGTESALVPRLWPLRVGNRAEWEGRLADGTQVRIEYEVESFGPLRVPAGLFCVFKVSKTYTSRSWKEVQNVWWSPSLKWNIKQYSERLQGPPRQPRFNNWELIGFSASAGTDDRQGCNLLLSATAIRAVLPPS